VTQPLQRRLTFKMRGCCDLVCEIAHRTANFLHENGSSAGVSAPKAYADYWGKAGVTPSRTVRAYQSAQADRSDSSNTKRIGSDWRSKTEERVSFSLLALTEHACRFARPRINRLSSCRRQDPLASGDSPTKGRPRPDERRGGPLNR
jgi:hypothetical protein